ncbi:hypothetical protein Tco_0242498 [Tanacetum coccineum]
MNLISSRRSLAITYWRWISGFGKSSRESKNGCGEVGRVEKISSTGSKFMANGEDCLDGCDGAGGGEVKGGRVDLGVVNSLLGEIPEDVMGESGGDTIRVNGGAIYSRWAETSFDKEERRDEG